MPNIVLTEKCNLKCPYCFAEEFRDKQDNVFISFKNYIKAKNFLLSNGGKSIGLIGGEPTLHPLFKDMLRDIIDDSRVKECTIFTNGLIIDKYCEELMNEKFKILINVNSIMDIGEKKYVKLVNNLDLLINTYDFQKKINIGINLYNPNMDYYYIIDLAKKFGLKKIRFSISVQDNDMNSFDYFKKMKKITSKFIIDSLNNEIVPYFDCNKLVSCMVDEQDKNTISKYRGLIEEIGNIGKNSLLNPDVYCSPVIDILPDLTAIRCFGLSEYSRVSISDFKDYKHLYQYYLNNIDNLSHWITSNLKCKDCIKHKKGTCYGGCLIYKIKEIQKLNEEIERFICEKR